MRCTACDRALTDKEATRKSKITNEYFDLCDLCLGSIALDIPNSFEEDDPLWDTVYEGDLPIDYEDH